MKINELLDIHSIDLNVSVASKTDAIDYMTHMMEQTGNLKNRVDYKKGVLAREESGTTGIGDGIAIPHSKSTAVKKAGIVAAVIKDGVDYDSLDGQPVHLIFMIAAPADGADLHLSALSKLSTMLMIPGFKDSLLDASSAEEFLNIIEKQERELDKKQNEKKPSSTSYRVLAVTACPTGIAHTFMAAESLEQKGKELGISVKVETQGAGTKRRGKSCPYGD